MILDITIGDTRMTRVILRHPSLDTMDQVIHLPQLNLHPLPQVTLLLGTLNPLPQDQQVMHLLQVTVHQFQGPITPRRVWRNQTCHSKY